LNQAEGALTPTFFSPSRLFAGTENEADDFIPERGYVDLDQPILSGGPTHLRSVFGGRSSLIPARPHLSYYEGDQAGIPRSRDLKQRLAVLVTPSPLRG